MGGCIEGMKFYPDYYGLEMIIASSFRIKSHNSIFGNYHQFKDNDRLTDNDLKYRFIKMMNGADSIELYEIEHTFIYERDDKVIDNIRKTVIDYEQKVIERAEELERARMKEEEAQRLLLEAEGLKNK